MVKMKALSIKEPWASMFKDGEKTIETRTWITRYRGEVLLCASKHPESKISGKAFAIGELVNCKPMVEEDRKLACCQTYHKAKSWFFKNITCIEPFNIDGQLGLFDVDESKFSIKRINK